MSLLDYLPTLLVIAVVLIAAALLWRWVQHSKFRRKATRSMGMPDLLQGTPEEFQEMVTQLFRSHGHQVKKARAQGNMDAYLVITTRNGQKWIAQTLRQRGRIDDTPVRELEKVLRYEKASKGILVATGTFTGEARQWANANAIVLYDGDEFLKMFRNRQANK